MKISLPLSLALLSAVTVWGQTSAPPPLDFEGANWLWTSEMAKKTVPAGTRYFRKVFTPDQGKIPVHVAAVSAGDDGLKLYANGNLLAQTNVYHSPQAACGLLNLGPTVFAVVGINTGGAATVMAKFRFTYSDGTTSTVVTDDSWKVSEKMENGFETLAFDDSKWIKPYIVSEYRVGYITATFAAQAIPQCPVPKLVQSELECRANTGKIEYLSAVPGVGCVCLSEQTQYWCGAPMGDDGAVQKCSDRTGGAGKRAISCYVECSPGLVATDQNTCSAPQAQMPVGSCPAGCVPAACEIDKAKQESRDEEERKAREEARQEREEARKAREEEREFREKQQAAMNPCECQSEHNTPPGPPPTSVKGQCSEPFTVSCSSPTSKCGCTSTFNQAKRRDPNAVQCLPPANHGRVECENTGPASSKCNIICDNGFQLTPDERDCIATARVETKSEFDCSADAENPGFLTADPVLGCICAHVKTENFCGVSTGDPDAEMMCSVPTDSWGHREAKCQVQCSEGFTATDQKTCVIKRPCIQDAPAVADAGMQELIKQTMESSVHLGVCRMGWAWKKIDTGYQCEGGTHFLTFAELGME